MCWLVEGQPFPVNLGEGQKSGKECKRILVMLFLMISVALSNYQTCFMIFHIICAMSKMLCMTNLVPRYFHKIEEYFQRRFNANELHMEI